MRGFSIPHHLSGSRAAPAHEVVLGAQAALPGGLNVQLLALYETCDGFLTDAGICAYEAAEIAERNVTFEVDVYAPGFVLFGDDSGGRGFLLHATRLGSPVYVSDLGDLDPDNFEVAGKDLAAWIEGL